MPRFVLLRHECPETLGKPSHWDLMFELGGRLLTWSVERLPASWPVGVTIRTFGETAASGPDSIAAVRLIDHRLAYLDYEGPLSDNRGEVLRADRGVYRLIVNTDEKFCANLQGALVEGPIRLEKQDGAQWTLHTSDG